MNVESGSLEEGWNARRRHVVAEQGGGRPFVFVGSDWWRRQIVAEGGVDEE